MSGDIHQISAEIGGLKVAVDTMTKLWQSQETAASEGRRQVHLKIDALKDEQQKLVARVNSMSKTLADIKPSVEAFESAKERAKGAQSLGKWLFTAIGFLGTALGYALANWITITPKPPLH